MAILAFDTWNELTGADVTAFRMFTRHYSFNHTANKRRSKANRHRIVGPGEKLVLMTPEQDALFCWRYSIYPDMGGQHGVSCTVFRNESPRLSSDLILAAEQIAWERWGLLRLFTYVNPRRVRSSNPGYCFIKAGWRRCGITKARKLLVFEKLPEWIREPAIAEDGR